VVYDAIVSALLGSRLRWRHAERTGAVRMPVGEAPVLSSEAAVLAGEPEALEATRT